MESEATEILGIELDVDNEKLYQVMEGVRQEVALLRQDMSYLRALLQHHDETLYGNHSGKVGHDVRLDRIEQREEGRTKTVGAIAAVLIGLVVKACWDAVTTK